MNIEETVKQICGLDEGAMQRAKEHWDAIAKPLNSLGLLEEAFIRIAGITGTERIVLDKKAVAVFCADNGIVEEGVTQTGQEVTAAVTDTMGRGQSCVCIMAEQAGADVFPVDIGVKRAGADAALADADGQCTGGCAVSETAREIQKRTENIASAKKGTEGRTNRRTNGTTEGRTSRTTEGRTNGTNGINMVLNCRLMNGTRNFTKAPAMDRETAVRAVETGIEMVRCLKQQGYRIIATGEMGIGNTTTSSAVIAVLLGIDPEEVTGRGAGLSTEGLARKREVIRRGIELWKPDRRDAVDVLSKVGGLDLAGLTGVFLGGALYRVPIVVDGLISSAAALAAKTICPAAAEYMLASHCSAEPAGELVLGALGLNPLLYGRLCLGEGTGAVTLFPLLDMAAAVYHQMSTFSQMDIEAYSPFDE